MKHSTASRSVVHALASKFGEPRPMRRGSVSERMVKCSKPACSCRNDPGERHGPHYSVTRKVEGLTQSRLLSPEQADVVRRQIQDGREFRDAVEVFLDACERRADEELLTVVPGAEAGAEKGGSGRRSPRRWRGKSKRSSDPQA